MFALGKRELTTELMARSIIDEGLHESGEPVSAINVTSLVDVMFCLLIMFMVATPLMKQEGMDVDLPIARGNKMTEEDFLYSVVSVDRAGNVFLGTLPLASDPAGLKKELSGNVKLREDGMVFIQGDQNAQYGRIVDVLVALKDAEVRKVGFVTDPHPNRAKEETP